jgi:glucose-6-phosphate 1-epimerase
MIAHKQYPNGFKYIEITNAYAHAKIALQGAHVFGYKAKNKPALLWLSPKAYLEEGKAIRGGIPLCFPWFGKHKSDISLPQHGFARTALWELVLENELDDGSAHIRLKLSYTKETLKVWAYKFEVYLDIIVGETLHLGLQITNNDSKAFEISTALHTYFNISHIADVCISGLEGCSYYDALTQHTKVQSKTLKFSSEVDRVYQGLKKSIVLKDATQEITIKSKGSGSLVVWNPWKQKSGAMADMSDNGYLDMVCLETSNAREDARVIAPLQTHSLEVTYTQI